MADEIGKGGDLISREQAIAALDSVGDDEIETYREGSVDENAAVQACLQALRSLPSVAPDPIEAEYREAAVALLRALENGKPFAWEDTRTFLSRIDKAARDGAR